jgi:hypothetical protein
MKAVRALLDKWTYKKSFVLLALFYFGAGYFLGSYADSASHLENAEVNLDLILGRETNASTNTLFISREYSYTLLYFSIFPIWLFSKFLGLDLDLNSAASVFYRNSIICFFGLLLVFIMTQTLRKLINQDLFKISPLFITLFPTIMGHSWFNEKDIPISIGLSLIVFAFLHQIGLTYPIRNSSIFILYFLIIIFSIGVRPALGILVLPFLFFLSSRLFLKKEFGTLKYVLSGSILGTMIVFITNKPFQEEGVSWFVNSVKVSGAYPWSGAVEVWSNFYRSPIIPGSYLLQVFLSQIPILFLFVCVINVRYLFQRNVDVNVKRNVRIAFTLILFLCTIFTFIIATNPIIYDDGRQLLFIWVFVYLSFLLFIDNQISLKHTRIKNRFKLNITFLVILTSGGLLLMDTVKLYPYNYVYRNEIASASRLKFETDYWGLSGKELANWVLKDSNHLSSEQTYFGYIFPQSFDPYVKNAKLIRVSYDDPRVDYYAQIYRPPLIPDQAEECRIVFSVQRKTNLGKAMTLGYIRNCSQLKNGSDK